MGSISISACHRSRRQIYCVSNRYFLYYRMSTFKIEATIATSNLQHREVTLSSLSQPSVSIQAMSLLTYDYESLLAIIREFMKFGGSSHLTAKALKIIGASLNDKKIAEGLQAILSECKESSRVYKLMRLWSSATSNIVTILLKLSPLCREQVITSIFSNYLLTSNSGSRSLLRFLPQLLSIVNQTRLFPSLTTAYHLHKEPFAILILNCQQIISQSSELLSFLKRVVQYGLQTSSSKLQQLVTNMSLYESAIDYLLQIVPNSSAVLIKYIRNSINHDNFFTFYQGQSSVAGVRKAALKEWLELPGNYCKIIDKYYSQDSDKRQLVLQLGRSLSKEGLYSSTLSIHYLYRYFKAQYIDFEREDNLLVRLKSHQPWIDVYKSITQCSSYEFFNLVAINITHAIKHWPTNDPFAYKIKNRDLQKVVQQVKKGYQIIRKEYLIRNKKIQLAFSTLLITIKASNTEMVVSFDNLRRHIDQNCPLRPFQEQYQGEEKTAEVKFQAKKDHNMIVEAHLVRLLKRSKQAVSIDWLSRQSKYDSKVVELAIKRLCNKDLAQASQNGDRYSYLV